MPRRLIGLLPETPFLRKLSILASGTVLGQALVILSSPLLTRLFTPAEFGVFAVFAGLAGIAGGLAGLRYEFAIPVMEADADAAALTA
ncbi:MAG: lipopolysaccharide biosynthesis protein, partial [Pseudomonadota bacterium]